MRRFLPFIGALALTPILAACAPRVVAMRAIAPILETGADAFYEEPDPQLAREAMGSHLKLIEALLKNDPKNPTLLALAAQGFGGYAFMFLEDTQPDRAKEFYLRGRNWGLLFLNQNEALRNLETKSLQDLEQALTKTTVWDAPGLFWAAYGWAGWINLSKDSPDAVSGLPKVSALMRRVQKLWPNYYFDGADLYLGGFYAALPKMLGGDPAKSKEHFEAAIKATEGKFLLAKTLEAQYYAVAAQDQALFKRLNEEVLASTDPYPEARLANEIAKIKSRRLLEKMNELF